MSEKKYWNDIQSENVNTWGVKPDAMILQYISKISKDKLILDLGCGDGRNSLYLASLGYDVEALDISENAIMKCKNAADRMNLSVDFKVADIKDFEIDHEKYGLIICSSVLQFFNTEYREIIVSKIFNALSKGGYLYMNVFTTSDSSYFEYKKIFGNLEENNSFILNNNQIVHYFDKNELLDLLEKYEHVAISDGMYLNDEINEIIGICHYVGRKNKQIEIN